MKIRLFLFLSLSLVLLTGIGCGGEDFEIDYSGFDCIVNNPNFQPEPIPAPEGTHQLSFTPNKTISVNAQDPMGGIEMITGRNRVFRYRYRLQATDTIERLLYFEIEPGIDAFTVSGTSLADINTYWSQSCTCPDDVVGTYAVEVGCIIGERLDANNWQVDININGSDQGLEFRLMASAQFKKVN